MDRTMTPPWRRGWPPRPGWVVASPVLGAALGDWPRLAPERRGRARPPASRETRRASRETRSARAVARPLRVMAPPPLALVARLSQVWRWSEVSGSLPAPRPAED